MKSRKDQQVNKNILAYPTSYAQKRIWFLSKLEEDKAIYNIGCVSKFKWPIAVEEYEKVLRLIAERHEAFRTNFRETEDGEVVQVIHEKREAGLKVVDISGCQGKNKKIQEKQAIDEALNYSFDLEKDLLARVTLLKCSEDEYVLIFIMHQIISDSWSISILTNEYFHLLQALYYKQTPQLPLIQLQYKDYAAWEQEEDQKKKLEPQEKYWLQKLSGALPVLDLPFDKPRPSVQRYETNVETIELKEDAARKINKTCQRYNVTQYTLLLAGFNVLLSKLSNSKDIIIGTYVANRDLPELDNVVGVFLNSLALRTNVDDGQKFSIYLSSVRETVLEAMENKEYPFEKLIEKLEPERDLSRSPIFNVVFQMFDSGGHNFLKKSIFYDSTKEHTTFDNSSGQFDLNFHIHTDDNKLILALTGNSSLFLRPTIKRFLACYQEIINNIIDNPEQIISELGIIPETEKQRLLNEINDTKTSYPKDKTIFELFETQTKKTPDNIAVNKLTYYALHKKVEQLACALETKKIKTGDRIGLCIDRSADTLVSMLAIFKLGAVYVPIDIGCPEKRIEYITKDADIKIVITNNEHEKKFKKFKIFNLDKEKLKKINISDSGIKVKSKSAAIIIYTSGSTGEPKGVALSHQGIINHEFSNIKIFKMKAQDKLAQNLSSSFVASIWQFIAPLFIGAEVVIYSSEINMDPIALFKKVEEDQVSILEISPATLKYFLAHKQERIKLKNLKYLLLTGEKTPDYLINNFYSQYTTLLVNLYGQAECSDDTLRYFIPRKRPKALLGKPGDNIQAYILDSHMKLVPVGVVGEIYISGDCLTEGYINKQEQTERVFLSHPFIQDKKIYKTGDLGRLQVDGNIEYIGRVDEQIKIKGRRIELGEIESQLIKLKEVRSCLALINKTCGEPRIVVYYIATQNIKAEKIREYLEESLPDYMIPTYYISLDKFPLNLSGKIDKLALPKPGSKNLTHSKYQAPQTKTEQRVVDIWQEVLGVRKIGRTDSFFGLGGSSLKAVQMISKLREQGYQVSLQSIFRFMHLHEFARELESETEEKIYGGVPFTAIGDWMTKNMAEKNIFKKLIVHPVTVVDLNIFNKSILRLKEERPKIKIKNQYEEKKSPRQVLETLNSKKIFEDIWIVLVKEKSGFVLIISRNEDKIDSQLFTDILLRWQKLYNLELAHIRDDKLYTPYCSYPNYYHCLHANVLEKLRWETNRFFYRSLPPAFDYFLVPSYCVVDDSTRRDSEFNAYYFGHKNIFVSPEKLGIEGKIIKLKTKEKALEYYQNQKQILLLNGNNYYLPSSPYYKNQEFINSLLEGRNLLPMNISIFSNYPEKKIVYSVNLNYFGQIKEEDFINYWQNFKNFNSLPRSKQLKIDLSFQVLKIENLEKVKSHNIEMLYKALRANVDKFFQNQIVTGSKRKGFEKIYFGAQVVEEFKKDIIKNIEERNNSVSDIVVIDMIKRLQKPWLFLKDLLQDICELNDDFLSDTKKLAEIIEDWDKIFVNLYKEVRKRKIQYEAIITFLPSAKLKQLKILNVKQKKELIKKLEIISGEQNKLYKSLDKKLNTLRVTPEG